MRLFNYLIGMLFSVSLSVANTTCDLDFNYINTGSNMTLAIQNSAISSISSLGNGSIGVFYSLNNENLICAGSTELIGFETAFPVMGDDQTTEDVDGLLDGQELFMLFETEFGDQYILTPHPIQSFIGNDIYYVNEFTMNLFCSTEDINQDEIYGCMDEDANNFNPEVDIDDLSCIYNTSGCTNLEACNFNQNANQDDGSCIYAGEETFYEISISPANWGGDTYDSEYNYIASVDESNDLGCHDYEFEFDGAIALIKRGDCQFSLKALIAQNAGASAVIIYNNSNGSMNMGAGSYSDEVHIPVYSMSGSEGHLLASWTENNLPAYEVFIEGHSLYIFIPAVDCNGNCQNDEDQDGVCDEDEIEGCLDNTACNYNQNATQDDDCFYSQAYYDCNGNCLMDEDNDGICDQNEIAQGDCFSLDYNYTNTGSNMTLALANSSINSIESLGEGYLGAFFTNSQGELTCAGSSFINGMETAFPIMGNDLTTDEIDGMENQSLNLIFTSLNGTQYQLNPIPNQDFIVNGLHYINSFDYHLIQCEDILGCMDPVANNFIDFANIEDGSCIYDQTDCGCTNETYVEYFTQGYLANCDNGSCQTPVQTNEISSTHFNQPLNTANNMTLGLDLSSIYLPQGTLVGVFYDLNGDGQINDNPTITSSNEVFYECVGLATFEDNFFSLAIWGDDAFTQELDGLPNGASEVLFAFLLPNQSVVMFDLSPIMFNYSSNGLIALDIINFDVTTFGCTDPQYCNYNAFAQEDDGSCQGSYGCMDEMYLQYNIESSCHSVELCEDTWQDEMLDMIDSIENIMSVNYDLTESLNDQTLLSVSLENDLLIANSIIANNQIQMADMTNQLWLLNMSIIESDSIIEQMNTIISSMSEDMTSMQLDIDTTTQIMMVSQANEIILTNIIDEMTIQMSLADLTINDMNSMVDELYAENMVLSNNSSSPIYIDLVSGWNIIGYTLPNSQDAVISFEIISEIITVVKDNLGQVYWPEFGYNGIGDLTPGHGYQVLVSQPYEDFLFESSDGLRIDISPMIPQWAIDMDVAVHPNDIKKLVRVVNNLGQEVQSEIGFKGRVLYYLYNDGSVEKKIKNQ